MPIGENEEKEKIRISVYLAGVATKLILVRDVVADIIV